MRRKLPWFEIAIAVVVLGATLYAALSDAYNMPYRWFIRDDAYYYFKVAQNITEGHGSTFDGIHLTNGYHPLWMLICLPVFALARFDVILPLRILVIITGILQTATSILIYRLVRSLLSEPVGVLAGSYWAFSSYILVFLYRTGVEAIIAPLFIVLLVTLLYQFELSWRGSSPSTRQLSLLAIAAALVVFSRLDLVFFALIVGVWVVLRESPLRYLIPLDILAITFSVLAAFLARLGLPGYYDASNAAVIMLVLAVVITIPMLYAFGLYLRQASWMSRSLLIRAGLAVLASSAMLSAAMLIGNALHLIPAFPKPALLFDAGIMFGCVLLIRTAVYLFGARAQSQGASSPFDELRSCWRIWLREGAIYYGILGGSLAVYMGWNRLAVGSFMPVSGEIKRWWGTFITSIYGGPPQNVLSFFGIDQYSSFNSWNPTIGSLVSLTNPLLYRKGFKFGNVAWDRNFLLILAILAIIVFLILAWRRQEARRLALQASIIPLFVGSWLQILSYSATGYASPKEWYWLTEPLLLVLGAAFLIHILDEQIFQRWRVGQTVAWVLVAAVALQGATAYWRDTIALYPYGQAPAGAAYAEVVPFLESHTEPGAIIGMTGGGNVGYFIHDRTIVNMDGLINSPQYFEALKAGTSSTYLYQTRMRFVFANPGLLNADPYRGQYNGRLVSIANWGGKDLMKLLPAPAK